MADSVVNLGAGAPDFSGMTMDEAMFGTNDPVAISRETRPSFDESGLGYFFQDGEMVPAADEEGYRIELRSPFATRALQGQEFEQGVGRASPYEGLAEPLTGQSTPDFTSRPTDLRGFKGSAEMYLQEGGAVEEKGILSALFNPLDDFSRPGSAEQGVVRESGREGSEGAARFYAEGSPTFEQVLEEQYGYPDVPRGDFYNTTEAMRAERPRHDMPTYQELEDARTHALMSATLAQEVGPETAMSMGNLSEFFDRRMPILGTATDADVVMDKRNNAFGIQLLNKAGIDASPQEIAAAVDQAVFDQLDRILDRKPGERSFKSPEGGIDVYFPRDRQGFFDINRYQTRD